MPTNSDRDIAPTIVPATEKRADRALADALRQFRQPPNSTSECQQPTRSVVIEVWVWIAAAGLIWAAVALSL
jgi:hypothetical protein